MVLEGNEIRRYHKQLPKIHEIDEFLEAELKEQIRISKLLDKGVLR
jgi:hypothetical protein